MVKIISIAVTLILLSCASSKVKLTQSAATGTNRVVFGKLVDLNPESDPGSLHLTYNLTEEASDSVMAYNKFPNVDPDSNFFWVSVPADTRAFAVTSLRFGSKDKQHSADIRDEKTHKPLFSTSLPSGTTPVYVGELVIRSGLKAYGKKWTGNAIEAYDLKEAAVKNAQGPAKEYLKKTGLDAQKMQISLLKRKK